METKTTKKRKRIPLKQPETMEVKTTIVIPPKVLVIGKNKKPEGKTLVNRLAKYFRTQNKPFKIELNQKQEIGKILLSKLYADGKKVYLKRTKVKEPEGVFEVIVYPPFFVPVIDATIHEYFNTCKELIK